MFEGKRHWFDKKRNLAAKDFNGYYGTNSVLVIKIVIETSINSSSSADRREDTDDEETDQHYTRT